MHIRCWDPQPSSLIWFPERRQSGFYPPGRGMKNAEQPKRRQLRRLMSEVSYDQELRSQSSQLRSTTRHSELPISILTNPPPLPKCLQTKQANSRTSRKPLLWHWETKTNRNKQVEGQWSCKEEKTSKNTKHIPTKSWVLPCWNKNSIILKKMHSKVKRMKHMNRRKEKLNKGVRWNIKLEKSSRK